MCSNGGGSNVNRETEHLLVKACPDADDARTGVYRHSDLPSAGAKRGLQVLQYLQITLQVTQVPFVPQSFHQTLQVSAGVVHVRLPDLDIVQMHDRIQRDHSCVSGFAHDLLVHLAAWWHVHHQVALDARGAGQAVSRGQRPPAGKLLLGSTQGCQVPGPRSDTVFGEVAFHDQ